MTEENQPDGKLCPKCNIRPCFCRTEEDLEIYEEN